jgi:hypothetical protein
MEKFESPKTPQRVNQKPLPKPLPRLVIKADRLLFLEMIFRLRYLEYFRRTTWRSRLFIQPLESGSVNGFSEDAACQT